MNNFLELNRISFNNEPKLSAFEADRKFNGRRIQLIPQIKDLLTTRELFKDQEIDVEFAHTGVSSLVCFVSTGSDKYVLKVPLSLTEGGSSEAEFLRQWEKVGVSVPQVYENGSLGEHAYTIMEYVDAPLLSTAIEEGSAKSTVYGDMGKTLATLHSAPANGYGRIVNGRPQHLSFQEWLQSEDIAKRVRFVQENNILGDEHGSITNVFDNLIAYAQKNPQSSYCHFDFSAPNLLATEPLTVFDPSPMLNLGIIDLGRSVLSTVFEGKTKEGEQLIEGYYSDDKILDVKALHASIVLAAYWKLPYQHKKGLTKKIELARNYLAARNHILK